MESFVNPPFELISTEQQSHLETSGDDWTFWWVKVKTPNYEATVMVTFDSLMRYCESQHPEIGAYYKAVRRNVQGFGPKHSHMLAIMDEEGFDHLPYIIAYVKDCCNLEHHHQKDLQLKQQLSEPKEADNLKAKVETLEQGMSSMRASTLRNAAFKDDLMTLLNNEVLERYPELFNSDPKYIKEVQGVLINTVLTFSSTIDSLAYRAAKES